MKSILKTSQIALVLKIVYSIGLCFLLGADDVAATGKGANGLYSINNRYAAVSDSNFDAIFVLDITRGGIVGQLILHDEGTEKTDWTNPTGISSCTSCPFLILSSTRGEHLYKVMLPNNLTFAEMAATDDFSELSNAKMIPYWPWKEFQANGFVKMVTMRSDGSIAFMAHREYGLFSLDPLHGIDANEKLLLAGDDIPGTQVAGLTLTEDEDRILLTTPEVMAEYKIEFDRTKNEISHLQLDTTLDLSALCGGGFYQMHFRDTVPMNENTWLAVGHKFGGTNDNRGMALYRIKYVQDLQHYTCHPLAGDDYTRPEWIDGTGFEVRFSRPHALEMTPNSKYLLITDIDNRALRKVKLDEADAKFGEVFTVSYDEGLWFRLYGDDGDANPVPPQAEQPLGIAKFRLHDEETTYQQYWQKSFLDAQNYCRQTYNNGRLCSLEELRSNVPKNVSDLSMHSFGMEGRTMSTWTSNGCSSCWLRNPGHCNATGPLPDSSESRDGSFWGNSVFMVANILDDGSIETQCRPEDTKVPSLPICCTEEIEDVPQPTEAQPTGSTNMMNGATIGVVSAGMIGAFLVSLGMRSLRQHHYQLKQDSPIQKDEGFEPVETSEVV